MRPHVSHRLVTAVVGLVIILLSLAACSADRFNNDDLAAATITPEILPFRFVVKLRRQPLDEEGKPISEEHVPVSLYGSGSRNLFHIGNDWTANGTLSCVVFYDTLWPAGVIRHVNVRTNRIHDHFEADINGDDVLDVAVVYCRDNSLFFDVLSPKPTDREATLLVAGEDRNDNGVWDGTGSICTIEDFDGDGRPEVLIAVETGYDLYPRSLICLSAEDRKVRWRYDVAGSLTSKSCDVLRDPSGRPAGLLVRAHPKNNGATTATMDDHYAYVLVLNLDGTVRWMRQTGGAEGLGVAFLNDRSNDGEDEIALVKQNMSARDGGDSSSTASFAVLLTNTAGEVIDSVDWSAWGFPRSLAGFAADNGGMSKHAMAFRDGRLAVFSSRLQVEWQCRIASGVIIHECRDFAGLGRDQLLVSSDDNRTWLLDDELRPLALFEDALEHDMVHSCRLSGVSAGYDVIGGAHTGQVTYYMSIENTPWYTVFFRQPWLASAAAALPLLVIVGLVSLYAVRIRQKNREINAAREELVAAQQKLIAAEKYAQAKDIAGGFAHEIRNALFPATSWLARLKRLSAEGKFDPAAAEFANDAVNRAIETTKLISAYTKLDDAMESEPTPLAEALEGVLRANRARIEELGVDVTVTGDSSTAVLIHRTQLSVLLNNVFVNSLDALTDSNPPRIITVTCDRSVGSLNVALKDNGPGIPDQHIARVFDVFYTTKPATGTGLGLAISKRIVEACGGTVSISSEPGEGTTVLISLKTHKIDDSPLGD